jgi:uncharacterized protein with HEPN domain
MGKDRAAFEEDKLLQSAVLYQLQIIGEAASHVPSEFRSQCPHIPWRDIIGMPQILVHTYRRIDLDQVWPAATTHLQQLTEAIKKILPPDQWDPPEDNEEEWAL